MLHHPPGHPGIQRLSRRSFLSGGLLAAMAAGRLVPARASEDIVLTFGVVADIHYAQLYADGDRYYRGSFQKLQDAVTTFKALDVDFVVELGDFIDAGGEKAEELDNLLELDDLYQTFPKKRYYVLGNHDLQRFDKQEYLGHLHQTHSQYSFDVKGVHFTVLDACFNPDASPYENGRFDWTKSFIPESGLNWLAEDMRWAAGRPVFVFLHQTLHNDGRPHCVVNAPAVRAILESHGDVRAVFQGHQHYSTLSEVGGIHYLTIAAMVNGRSDNTYSVVHLTANGGIVVDSYGRQRHYQW